MEKGISHASGIRIVVILLVGAALGTLVYYSPAFFNKTEPPSSEPHLQTGGTSVIDIMIENRWRRAYDKDKHVKIDYDSTGSTRGLKEVVAGNTAIAFTHAAMPKEQQEKAREKGGEVVHIPVILCAVVPVYHLKDLKEDSPPLNFTGEVLARIYLGEIKKWDDPALQELNKKVKLPDKEIIVVHRKDSSGTTYIFADYLAKASPAWKEKVGEAKNEIKWPVGEGQERNHGVASFVQRTDGAIGYVDLLHAFTGEIAHGAVQNADKSDFIHAKAENMTAAAEELLGAIPDDLTFDLTYKPGKKSYPICGAVWAVCYRNQPEARRQQVVDFLTWVTHEGQKFAEPMSYAPLPQKLVERAEEKIKSIK